LCRRPILAIVRLGVHGFASFLSWETGVILAHCREAFVCASQGTVGICIGVFLSLRTYDIIMDMDTFIHVYIYIFRWTVHPWNFRGARYNGTLPALFRFNRMSVESK
jgi:hypothetical protein